VTVQEVDMGWLRNPLVQFLAVAAFMLAVIVVATGRLSERAADDEAIADARELTWVLARSVAEPAIPRGLVEADPAAIDALDRRVLDRLLVGEVRRIKLWSGDGDILYSDETRLIGTHYEIDEDERAVLSTGSVEAEISDLAKPENRYERGMGDLLEVYTAIDSPEGERLLFEVYYSTADIAAQRELIFDRFRPITLGALIGFVALTTPLFLLLMRRVRRHAEERERLLHSAINASDAERARIARDLHDGVVQDLAGSSLALSSAARDPELAPHVADKLDRIGGTGRTSMRSLRSLLVEIYPPDLHAGGLEPALSDLLAPLRASAVDVRLSVDDLSTVEQEQVALLWRVAQEAVRNAARHAAMSSLDVSVVRRDGAVVLTVADDGRGFVTEEVPVGRLGLRGLQDLCRDSGGHLRVDSTPGTGTTVKVEVPVP
jgi:signal transduction histidine kinase